MPVIYHELGEPPPFETLDGELCPGGLIFRIWTEDRTVIVSDVRLRRTDGLRLVDQGAADGWVCMERARNGIGSWLVCYDGDTGVPLRALHVYPADGVTPAV